MDRSLLDDSPSLASGRLACRDLLGMAGPAQAHEEREATFPAGRVPAMPVALSAGERLRVEVNREAFRPGATATSRPPG
jgi:hypothetical protein